LNGFFRVIDAAGFITPRFGSLASRVGAEILAGLGISNSRKFSMAREKNASNLNKFVETY
jgi:hypothetical protein